MIEQHDTNIVSSTGERILTRENKSNRRKMCPSVNLSNINLTYSDLGSNAGLRGSMLVTNGLWQRHLTFFFLRSSPQWVTALSFTRILDHTQRPTTVGRAPLDEWSIRHRDLYLTTHNTHNRQTSMAPVGFEPTISAGERPQSCALDRAATGTGI